MSRHRAYGLMLESDLPLPGLAPGEGTEAPDIRVLLRPEAPEAPESPETAADPSPEGPPLRFTVEGVATYVVEGGRRITILAEPGALEADLRLFLLGSAMGALLCQRGLVPFHGSAVATPRGAMVFVGPSGIGKSTLAAHFRRAGHRLLSDDICAVSADTDGRPQVLPAFPHVRLRADALARLGGIQAFPATRLDVDKFVVPLGGDLAEAPLALGAMHVLTETAGPLERVPLSGFPAIEALAANLYRPSFLLGRPVQERFLILAAELARESRVLELRGTREAGGPEAVVAWLQAAWLREGSGALDC